MTPVTNYFDAVHYFNNSFVLCNNLPTIDASVYDNMSFSTYNEETEEYIDIYQWFVSDCSAEDVKYLSSRFGLLFTYSDLLECYVLCVQHWGTHWSGVSVTDNEFAEE